MLDIVLLLPFIACTGSEVEPPAEPPVSEPAPTTPAPTVPAPMPPSARDLVLLDCAPLEANVCASGTACRLVRSWSDDGTTLAGADYLCVPNVAGLPTVAEGDVCERFAFEFPAGQIRSTSNCEERTMCVSRIGDDVSRCRPACANSAGCAADRMDEAYYCGALSFSGTVQRASVDEVDDVPLAACFPADGCDLVAPDCAENTSCQIVLPSNEQATTTCLDLDNPDAPLTVDVACDRERVECEPGLVCTVGGVCAEVCDVADDTACGDEVCRPTMIDVTAPTEPGLCGPGYCFDIDLGATTSGPTFPGSGVEGCFTFDDSILGTPTTTIADYLTFEMTFYGPVVAGLTPDERLWELSEINPTSGVAVNAGVYEGPIVVTDMFGLWLADNTYPFAMFDIAPAGVTGIDNTVYPFTTGPVSPFNPLENQLIEVSPRHRVVEIPGEARPLDGP